MEDLRVCFIGDSFVAGVGGPASWSPRVPVSLWAAGE